MGRRNKGILLFADDIVRWLPANGDRHVLKIYSPVGVRVGSAGFVLVMSSEKGANIVALKFSSARRQWRCHKSRDNCCGRKLWQGVASAIKKVNFSIDRGEVVDYLGGSCMHRVFDVVTCDEVGEGLIFVNSFWRHRARGMTH